MVGNPQLTAKTNRIGREVGWIVAPLVAVLLWSSWPAVQTFWAVSRLGDIKVAQHGASGPRFPKGFKRSLQKKLLASGIYVPTEDIIGISIDSERLVELTRRACGPSELHVWIPLTVRLPIVGQRTYEWCWKPKVKSNP